MSNTKTPATDRTELVEYLRSELVGPSEGATEVIVELPFRRYLAGVLYPQGAPTAVERDAELPDLKDAATGREERSDDPVSLAYEWDPSSLGVSFFIPGGLDMAIGVWGATYEEDRLEGRKAWRRVPLSSQEAPEVVELGTISEEGTIRVPVLVERGQLFVRKRSLGSGYLMTVSLLNRATRGDDEWVDPGECLYQVGLACTPLGGPLLEYPSVDRMFSDAEEEDLRCLYRDVKTYAIGHGCAADWSLDDAGSATEVRSTVLPTVEVPPVVAFTSKELPALSPAWLGDPSVAIGTLEHELTRVIDDYEAWKVRLERLGEAIPERYAPAAARLLGRIGEALGRMREGIALISGDQEIREAFRLANLAMVMQMRHGAEDLAGSVHVRDEPDPTGIDYDEDTYRWYPFQLAFQLLVLESVANEASTDRRVVDLLWFPTGGGKTEAYLAVSAFAVFLRRLRMGDAGGGTTVLTRYTLRLLTTQQFQRAATLVCAAELLRRDRSDLGDDPISIGLWVGEDSSPNSFTKADESAMEVLDSLHPRNPFPLQKCPWCGTRIVPERHTADHSAYGFSVGPFRFRCPTGACPFHSGMPVSVVDEDLYEHPPTILLATVDKFARMAWLSQPSVFFGSTGNEPPSLILQDELHLLSGPLGTTMGLYERAIAGLIELRGGNPKILASTATIRNGAEQVRALFGRPVGIFPPAGLDHRDSYFAKVDTTRSGRLYVGLMAQGHTVATSIVHSAAALLQGPVELEFDAASFDGFGTLVVYSNSLRELGRTVTLASDDIPARIRAIATDETKTRRYGAADVVELTGNITGSELPGILERLERGPEHGDSISVLCTTSMLSVGVDIPRLALMIMNGQPKTASEYIQATSRVGRSKIPGLVLTLLSSTKPRDRSHYEGFVPFHRALYRHVEPTSATPFSNPSRQRALHAALVILMRHGAGLSANDAADRFRPDSEATKAIRRLLMGAVETADRDEVSAVERHLDRLINEWAERVAGARREGKKLHYEGKGKSVHGLLTSYGRTDGWETLHSMRNVDRASVIDVRGELWND